MAYKTTLPWRKFPRDTLHNPSLRFIINRMEKEERQAVFTLFLALYCEADDDGFVDISDAEFFADQCLMDVKMLELLLQHFEKRRLIERVAEEVPIYRIVDWLSPYPQSGGGKTAAERQKEYRERKKEEAHETDKPEPSLAPPVSEPDTPADPVEPKPSLEEHHDEALTTDNDTLQEVVDAQMSEDICTLIKKGADLTDDELIAQILLYKDALKNGATRKEAQEAAGRSCSVPEEMEKAESEKISEVVDERGVENVEKSVMPPVTDDITECNALHNGRNALHNGRNALRPKIREEERDEEKKREVERDRAEDREVERESETEREKERSKQKENQKENPESGNAVQGPASERDYSDVQHREGEGDEEQEIQGGEQKCGMVSWVTALWESVSRDEDIQGLDEAKRAGFEAFLSGHFKKTAGVLYSISDQERASLRFLSIFLPPLADEQNSVEVVASQFVGVLNNFIKKGMFFGYEQCTARTLCSSYIFEPVFLKVEKILQAKTGGGARWGQCLISCLKHLKAAEYAVLSIDSG